ncbi:MAG TPA: hypothetical protein VF753_17125 [Terriglobales bacterium]
MEGRATRRHHRIRGRSVISSLRDLIEITVLALYLAVVIQPSAQRTANSGKTDTNVILGVLEDLPGEYAGDHDFRAVRAIFKKIGDDWQAFPTKTKTYHDVDALSAFYPKEMTWSIAFDGKKLGTITAETPSHFRFYSEIGIEHITSHGQIPTIGGKSVEYSGDFHIPVYRPLVAVSRPNVSDPEQWKVTELSHELIAAARQQFRLKFPQATNCRNPQENIARPWKYRDEDIRVTKAYSSKDKWSLIELNLTGNACDGEQGSQDEFHGQWFVIEPAGEARFLGSDMWLVDAGDYDNDGRSEVLFAIDAHNLGGYRLFYRGFAKCAEFAFHYH